MHCCADSGHCVQLRFKPKFVLTLGGYSVAAVVLTWGAGMAKRGRDVGERTAPLTFSVPSSCRMVFAFALPGLDSCVQGNATKARKFGMLCHSVWGVGPSPGVLSGTRQL